MSTEARQASIPPRPTEPPKTPPEEPPAVPEKPSVPPQVPGNGDTEVPPRFPNLRAPASPPPPPSPSARFPDAPPTTGRDTAVPPRRTPAPPENAAETTFRLRPIKADPEPIPEPPHASTGTWTPFATQPTPRHPDPSLSWSAPAPPAGGRPVVSFGQPEGYDGQTARPRPLGGLGRGRLAAVAACMVLGLGLIGGAVTGSWLIGDTAAAETADTFAAAQDLWHSVPVDDLFPTTVEGQGAGPGGADRTWTRIAVAPDSGCKDAFDPLLRKALAPVGCKRLLRATYTDATQSYVTTVGLLFTKGDSAAMTALDTRFSKEDLGDRADLMPRSYAAKGTVAADFGTEQRASWTISVLTDAPVVVYAVSGWADGRGVDEPESAAKAMQSGATSAVAQAGLGHEAKGLADRIERGFRQTVKSEASEQPS